MRTISQNFRREYIKGNRNYLITINMTLADDTELTLTNEDIWEGGFSFEEGISSTNTFDIGSAIVGKCSVVIDNINENFSQYDFFNATMWVYLGLKGLEDENPIRIGYYTVDETQYNGSLITLNCLDNMWRFDIPFSTIQGITYPTTARTIITAMCSYSGIGISLATQTFHGYNKTIEKEPTDVNCREVLQYIAQICCCYCKINSEGNLELKWIDKTDITGITDWDGGTYNTTTTPYSDGCDLDGGSFNPWNLGDVADGGAFYDPYDNLGYITSNSQMQVGTDDIWVTGVRVCTNDPNSEDGYDYLWVDSTLEQTHERYILVIQDNPLITPSNASAIATDIGTILAGTPIRTFQSSSLSDISIESGDPVQIVDFRGNWYRTWVTNLKFTSDNYESFSCGAESPMTNKVVRYSESIKTLTEAKKKAQEVLSAYDQAVKNMNELASQAFGYHEYTYTVGTSKIMWRYSGETIDTSLSPASPSNPRFPDSNIVWKITVEGVFISDEKDDDGFQIFTSGYDANTGTALLKMMYVIGLNADWINAGHITANRIDAATLSAITADLGEVTTAYIKNPQQTSYINLRDTYGSFKFSGQLYSTTLDTVGRFCADRVILGEKEDIGYDYVMMNNGYINLHAAGQIGYYSMTWVQIYNAAVSDKRLKKNIKAISVETSKKYLESAKPKTFYFKSGLLDDGKIHQGFIAQEVVENLKKSGVDTSNLNISYVGEDGYYKLNYSEFIPHLVNVVTEQQTEIELLKEEIKLLKERMDKLDGNTSS